MITRLEEKSVALVALPVLVDVVTAVALWLMVPLLGQQFVQPAGQNALLLAFVYALFCLAIYALRKLQEQPGDGGWQMPASLREPKVRGAIGVLFGLLMVTMIAFQLGYFAAITEVGAGTLEEGSTAAFFVFAPGAWLGFSMLIILVLAFPVRATVAAGRPAYALLAVLALVVAGGMFVLVAGQLAAVVTSGVAWPVVAAAAFLALALALLPARLAYQSKQPHAAGALSYFLLLFFALWRVLAA